MDAPALFEVLDRFFEDICFYVVDLGDHVWVCGATCWERFDSGSAVAVEVRALVAEFGFDWFGVADDGGYFRWFPDVPGQSENGAKMWPGHARMMDGCSLPVVEWREGSGDPLLFHAVTAAGSGAWFDAALVGRFVGRFDARIQGGLACPVVFVDGAGDPVACVAGVGGAAVRAAGGVVGS